MSVSGTAKKKKREAKLTADETKIKRDLQMSMYYHRGKTHYSLINIFLGQLTIIQRHVRS